MTGQSLRVGIDFDNTIACYDNSIKRASIMLAGVPSKATNSKDELRKFLVRGGREDDWTEFQGYLYGPGIDFAQPFKGFLQTLQILRSQGHRIFIVSHKTEKPFAGPEYDLHAYARKWISVHINSNTLQVGDRDTYFELTINAKIERIKQLKLDYFIDDLVPIARLIKQETETKPILFDPNRIHGNSDGYLKMNAWVELIQLIS